MLARKGVAAIIFTDISKDGMLGGTNSELYKKLSEIPKMEIITSGGVTYMEEIGELSGYVSGVIIGKKKLLNISTCYADICPGNPGDKPVLSCFFWKKNEKIGKPP